MGGGYIVFNKTKFYSHPIYDSYYASKKGEIYSLKGNKLLKLGKHNDGYLYFILYNKPQCLRVHSWKYTKR